MPGEPRLSSLCSSRCRCPTCPSRCAAHRHHDAYCVAYSLSYTLYDNFVSTSSSLHVGRHRFRFFWGAGILALSRLNLGSAPFVFEYLSQDFHVLVSVCMLCRMLIAYRTMHVPILSKSHSACRACTEPQIPWPLTTPPLEWALWVAWVAWVRCQIPWPLWA
jgi:hypothetical protein